MCQNFLPLYGWTTFPGWTDSIFFISLCADSLWLLLPSGCCECACYKHWNTVVYVTLLSILLGVRFSVVCNPMFSVLCVIPCLVCSGAHILFFRVCPVLHGPQQWTKTLIFPSFCQRLVFCIIVTNIAMMMGVRWCLISSDLCFLRLMTVSGFSWAYCLFAQFLWRKLFCLF